MTRCLVFFSILLKFFVIPDVFFFIKRSGGEYQLNGRMRISLGVPDHRRDKKANIGFIQDKRLLGSADGFCRDNYFSSKCDNNYSSFFMRMAAADDALGSKIGPKNAPDRKR